MKSKLKNIFRAKSFGKAGYISIVGLMSIVFFVVSASQTLASSSLLDSESELIRLTNEIRAEAGAKPLVINYTLARSAEAKAYDMAVNGYFAHEDQLGRRVSYWLKNNGYNYLRAGENLARGFDDPLSLMQAWMRSETHYANLVNQNYTEIGIGITEGVIHGKPAVFVVQHFGEPFPLPTLTWADPVQANVLGDITINYLSEPMLRDLPTGFSPEVGPAYQGESSTVVNESFIGTFLVASSDAANEVFGTTLNIEDRDIQETDIQEYILYSEASKILMKAVFMLLIALFIWQQSKKYQNKIQSWIAKISK